MGIIDNLCLAGNRKIGLVRRADEDQAYIR
jgi:hypothetical protein